MPGTVSYLQKEPVWVLAGADIDNLVLLGLLNEGDATVTITPTWTDQLAHQTGVSIIQKYFNGSNIVAEFELAEVLNVDIWETVFPMGDKVVDESTPPEEGFAFSKDLTTEPYVGQKGTAKGLCWCFRPVRSYVDASTETDDELVIPVGVSVGPVVLTFSTDTAQVLPVEIHGLFDPDGTDGRNFAYRGLSAGTWAPA